MESIINPWLIYFLSILNSILGICIGALIISTVITIGGFILWVNEDDDNGLRLSKKILPCVVFFLLLVILIPSKNTVITMYVADKITWNNIEKTVEIGANVKETIKKDVIDILSVLYDEEDLKENENVKK